MSEAETIADRSYDSSISGWAVANPLSMEGVIDTTDTLPKFW